MWSPANHKTCDSIFIEEIKAQHLSCDFRSIRVKELNDIPGDSFELKNEFSLNKFQIAIPQQLQLLIHLYSGHAVKSRLQLINFECHEKSFGSRHDTAVRLPFFALCWQQLRIVYDSMAFLKYVTSQFSIDIRIISGCKHVKCSIRKLSKCNWIRSCHRAFFQPRIKLKLEFMRGYVNALSFVHELWWFNARS